jgi:hypothetical protein
MKRMERASRERREARRFRIWAWTDTSRAENRLIRHEEFGADEEGPGYARCAGAGPPEEFTGEGSRRVLLRTT